ncbi:hypothetical protein [Turneriella parva]|nr:hypothetical protein [Turneriella parva]
MSLLMLIGVTLSLASGLYLLSVGIAKLISENVSKDIQSRFPVTQVEVKPHAQKEAHAG